MENIKLVIDNETIEKYYKEYFKKYPKRKRRFIERPTHPSVNQWMIMKRLFMNNVKSKWKEFIVWFVEKEGLKNKKIEKCSMRFVSYFKTKIRQDVDNTVPKFILDGLVEGGLIIDDDYLHLVSLTLQAGYDKFHPRTEIYIMPIEINNGEIRDNYEPKNI